MIRLCAGLLATLLAITLAPTPSWAATKFVLINADGPGEGLNDPTARAPVGGNPGATLGAQRRYAMLFAARLLASRVHSDVPIRVRVQFNPLPCDADSAQLGGAGTIQLISFQDNPPARARAHVLYPAALANALAGRDLSLNHPDIGAVFNSNLDERSGLGAVIAPCLQETHWYYGFDHQPPADALNFINTAVHELIHGLGFASFARLRTGEQAGSGIPDIYSLFIHDQAKGAAWPDLSRSERADSATNAPFVVWTGSRTTSSGVPSLTAGTRLARIRLYAPDPLQIGSSISHWSDAVAPDDLMEPFATGGLIVTDGIGLASCVLYDLGWRLTSGVACPDRHSSNLASGIACMDGVCGIPAPGGGTGNGGTPTDPPAPDGGPLDGIGDLVDGILNPGGDPGAGDGGGGSNNPPTDNGGTTGDTSGGGNNDGTGPTDLTNMSGGGGGGGCTLAAKGRPDPAWLLLALLAVGMRRRTRLARRCQVC